MRERIEEVLEQYVRPRLAMHAGGIEFVNFNEASGVLSLRFSGMCRGCPMSQMTLKLGVEALMKERLPEVTSVEAV